MSRNIQQLVETSVFRVSKDTAAAVVLHQLKGFSSKIFLSMLSILILELAVVAYFSHRLSSPLEKLKQAAQWVAEGETGKQIPTENLQGTSEVLDAIKQFNQRSLQLAQLEKHNQQLQNK